MLWVVLGAGLVVLVWAGTKLQGVFLEEYRAAHDAVHHDQAASAGFAHSRMTQRLSERLARARRRIDAARRDPLEPDHEVLLVVEGEQVLPRFSADESEASGALAYLSALRNRQAVAAPTPLREELRRRETLLRRLEQAVAATKTQEIVQTVRETLTVLVDRPLPPGWEVPWLVRFMEVFLEGPAPDRFLVRGLLRDGLRGTRGRIEGLQRLVLRHREQFSQAEFRALTDEVISLSDRVTVPREQFFRAARAVHSHPVGLPVRIAGPMWLEEGWYLEPDGEGSVVGVKVDDAELVAEVRKEMTAAGVVDKRDGMTLERGATLQDTEFRIASPRFAEATRQADQRFWGKTALGLTLGLLAVAIVGLVARMVWQERQLMRARTDFVASVSHELRTPLASMRLLGETLERKLAGNAEARDFPTRIVREADRLSLLVENILSFSRLEKGGFVLRPEALTAGEALSDLSDQVTQLSARPVEIDVTGDPTQRIWADPELFRLLLSNLLSNAIKHNTEDVVKIRVGMPAAGVLHVEDNGVGISEQDQERIFREFLRLENGQKAPSSGIGLGLAVCARIAQLHGGRIRVAKSGHVGSLFEVIFPTGAA